jgi:drug/metabolite transporter (DMT)-like permease
MDVEKAEAALSAGALDRKAAERFPAPNLSALVALVFVLIWSTGFIGARYGMPYAEPATFLALRFGGVLLIMVPAVLLLRVPAPAPRLVAHLAVAGLLLQGGYLLGVFEAIRHGMGLAWPP